MMESVRGFLGELGQYFGLIVRPAYRSLRENTGLAALSVVLAFGLWIFVTDAENPTRTRVLPVDIPVEAVNVEPNVVVANDLETVRVRISVEENVLEDLTVADFEATVDLQGLTVGEWERPVEVNRLTTRGGLRVDEVLPNEKTVVLVAREAKIVPVFINVTGEPAAGYEMDSPEPEETSVRVSGPAENIELVTQAVGTVAVNGRTEAVDQAVRLEPRDDNGNLVEKLTLDPPIIDVAIEIEETIFSRPVAVGPVITGVPADGYNVVGFSSSPATVTIRGDQASIARVTTIPTQGIDVEGESENVVKTVSLELPQGITVVGSPNVTVTVRVQPIQGSVRFEVPLTLRGLGSGLTVRGELPSVQVTLKGLLPGLLALSAEDVVAFVDLTGKEAGDHIVAVEVDLPEGALTTSRTATPSEVTLSLEEG